MLGRMGRGFGRMSSPLGGGLHWIINPGNYPDLMLDFSNNRAWTKSTALVSTAASLLTVSRASTGYVNDASGNWTSVANNLPRISNNGLLVEEARTNSIRNNSMTGAVVMADSVELTTNGNFASAGTGWTSATAGAGSVTFGTGTATITGDGATNGNYISQQITGLTVGRNYVISITATNSAGFNAAVGTVAGGTTVLAFTGVQSNTGVTVNSDRVGFTATATSHWVTIARQTGTAGVLTSVSVQDGERCENGGFTSNPLNAAQSTLQNGWEWRLTPASGTATVTFASNAITITGDGTNSAQVTTSIPTIAGCAYTITVDVTTNTASVQAGTAAFGSTLLNVTSGTTTGQKFQFTASGTTSWVTFSRSAAAGAVIANVSVKSAGALPTNWVLATPTGALKAIAGIGTSNGIDYIDVQISGSITATTVVWEFDSETQIAATYGQTWTASAFVAISGGSDPGITWQIGVREYTSGGAFVTQTQGSISPSATLTRVSQSATLSGTTTAFADPGLRLAFPTAATNITIRIGWPQFENNSLINSTVASATTAANGTGGVNGSAVYSVGGGTGSAATLNVTWSAGVLTVNSVASAGSYTVFPPSPAALTYVSGTATGWTGATVNLTPTNLAAQAFATSPIRTTAAAATRAADVVTVTTPPAFGSAYSLFAKGIPQAPTGFGADQSLLIVDDGTANNRLSIRRAQGTGLAYEANTSGGVTTSASIAGAWAQNASGKLAAASAAGDQAAVFNGSTPSTGAGSLPVSVVNLRIGEVQSGANQFNGFLSQAAIWSSSRVPNAQLQAITT